MSKFEKIFGFLIIIFLIFGLYKYKVFNDIQYKKNLAYATNNLYSISRLQKCIYDDYNNIYMESISKNTSFSDIYSNESHIAMKDLNLQRIKLLNQHFVNKYVLEGIENPRTKYKKEYDLFLEAHDYYINNINKFNLNTNTFKQSDYTEFLTYFKELDSKIANLMRLLDMPEYDAYYN